jgi:hypothetical protein
MGLVCNGSVPFVLNNITMEVRYEGPPMDEAKKHEVAMLVIEASRVRRWLWVFLGISMLFGLLRIGGMDSIVMLIGHGLCLLVAWGCYRKGQRLLNKATQIIVDEVEKSHRQSNP